MMITAIDWEGSGVSAAQFGEAWGESCRSTFELGGHAAGASEHGG